MVMYNKILIMLFFCLATSGIHQECMPSYSWHLKAIKQSICPRHKGFSMWWSKGKRKIKLKF